jgi:O-antigen ligase
MSKLADWLPRALVASLGPILFIVPLFLPAPLFVLALLAGWSRWRAGGFDPWQPPKAAPLLGLMLLWAALSFLWTPMPAKTVPDALRAAAVLYAGLLLIDWARTAEAATRERLLVDAARGLAVGCALALIDIMLGGALIALWRPEIANQFQTGYSRSAALTAIAAVPLALGLWRVGRREVAVGQALLAAAAVIALTSLSAKLALAAGVLTAGLVLLLPRLARPAVLLLTVLVAATPLAVAAFVNPTERCDVFQATKASVVHRMAIWRFAAERAAEHALLGNGMNSSKAIPQGYQDIFARCPLPEGVARGESALLPLHPHNNALQIWLELGAVGLGLAVVQLGWLLWRAAGGAPDRLAKAAVAGAAAAALEVASVSYGVWQSWWIAGVLLLAAMTTAAAARGGASSSA